MLIRLFLLSFVVSAIVFAWRWRKASKLIATGGLSTLEVRRLLKIAQSSKRLEAALLMRTRILGQAKTEQMRALSERVDPAIRTLALRVEDEAGDRIIRELQNVHLAQVTSGDVESSLDALEEASDELTRSSALLRR